MSDRPVAGTREMIMGMMPEIQPGRFVYVVSEDPKLVKAAIATFRESEGQSLIIPVEAFPGEITPVMKQITLTVYSSLEGVGLTAAVSEALTEAAIPCNVVAAFHHDHIFVPEDQAGAA